MKNDRQTFLNWARQFKEAHELQIIGPLYSKKNLSTVDRNKPIVFLDGGLNSFGHIPGLDEKTTFYCGDSDSLRQTDQDLSLIDKMQHKVLFHKNKDFSDFAGLLLLTGELFQKITSFGLLGGRLDHQLYNLGEVTSFLDENEKVKSVSFDKSLLMINKNASFQIEVQGLFSVFSLNPAQITISGDCQFSVKNEKLSPLSSKTLSNKAHGKIEINCDQAFGLYLPESSLPQNWSFN